MTTLGAVVQLVTAALFAWSALLARDLWCRDRAVADKYIAVGLVVAAFAQIMAAVYPGTHPGPVSAADILSLGFYVILLLAIESEARSVLSSLRTANETLEQLRISEVERAAVDERARLSRELHDGLAQALWLAKLKFVRLRAQPGLSSDTRELATETAAAVELGLSEARQAVLAMHTSATTDSAFSTLLERYVDDYGDRFAIPVEFSATEPIPPLPARMQAELLRIAQEALANVHRHADATSVGVSVGIADDEITLAISDDGQGFVVDEVSDSKFGLSAMRERAGLICGRLRIWSKPGEGTTVSVTAPLQPVSRSAS